MNKRNLVLAYLLLVGLPALGLLGVLRAGQRLTPPISVGGAWNLDADYSAMGSVPCAQLLGSIKQPFFTISQSGTSLVFNLNDTGRSTFPGDILGSAMTMGTGGFSTSSNPHAECGDPQAIHLEGAISSEGDQRIFAGSLGIRDCAQCTPVSFRAVRQAPPASGAR
jgi:hypothetical protein